MSVALSAYRIALEMDGEFYALSQVASATAGTIYLRANQSKDSASTWEDAYQLHNPFHAHLMQAAKRDRAREFISAKQARALLELANNGSVPSWAVRQLPIKLLEDAAS